MLNRKPLIAILGGTGKMGCWFAKYFQAKGFKVVISGRQTEKTRKIAMKLKVGWADTHGNAVAEADYVMMATTIDSTAETIRAVAPITNKSAIIFDIASVKSGVIDALKEAGKYGLKSFSLHPMFGPGTTTLENKNFAVIPVGEPSCYKEITDIFRKDGATIWKLKDEVQHDEIVAFSLSLAHFVNILFGNALSSAELSEVRKLAGPTFQLQAVLSASVLKENPELYSQIQLRNPSFVKLTQKIKDAVAELVDAIQKGNEPKFVRIFNRASNVWVNDKESATAYEKMYAALRAIERKIENVKKEK